MNEWYVNQNTVILYKTTNKTKSHYYLWPMAKTHFDMLFHLKMFIVNLKFEKKNIQGTLCHVIVIHYNNI